MDRGPGHVFAYLPGCNPGVHLKSISHRCYLREEAFEWELTKETIYLPLGCFQGGSALHLFDRHSHAQSAKLLEDRGPGRGFAHLKPCWGAGSWKLGIIAFIAAIISQKYDCRGLRSDLQRELLHI